MSRTVRVDLHLHSDVSDGYFAPATIADKAADAGVRFAALCDHSSIAGWRDFEAVFTRRGGVAITGLEIHAEFEGREIHLLGYGFDPEHPMPAAFAANAPVRDAIAAVHAAGGLVFLAHPFAVTRDPDALERIVQTLRREGLDGLEAIYTSYDDADRRLLADLADRIGLLVSAGSDFHGPSFPAVPRPGIEMDHDRWHRFRSALPAFRATESAPPPPAPAATPARGDRWFTLHILLPALLTIALFVTGLFGAVLPALEENLMARKREMIRELTNSAWSIVAAYEADARAGRLTTEEAQVRASEEIGRIRYGPEAKDYFWITDTSPRMIMHPYRPDLVGQDLSDFTDPNGVRLFVEIAHTAAAQDHGTVDYVWQWKDDPERLAPKESYVRRFSPWGWIIGTGLYIEDVHREITGITRRFVDLSAAIILLVGAVLAYLIRQSYRLERRRRRSLSDLRSSHERFHLLVEAATEGTLMALEDRCAYANPTFLKMAGYTSAELPYLTLSDLFPSLENLHSPGNPEGMPPDRFETILRRKSGETTTVLATPTRVNPDGREGWILVVNEGDRTALRETTGAGGRDARSLLLGPEGAVMRHMPPLIGALADGGVPVRQACGLVTSLSDSIADRILRLAIEEMGKPPLPFGFLAFGSEGRSEQTLVTDQDNGLIHEDCDEATAARAEEYFARLGARVCDDLNRAGYSWCRGEAMARNQKWRGPLARWKLHFDSWINAPNPAELLHFNIFFDFRIIHGNAALGERLRRHIDASLENHPSFFFHLASNALHYRPPLDLLGRIAPNEETGLIDLKAALMPVVNFARLYALKHHLIVTNTIDRIRGLEAIKIFDPSSAAELRDAYDFLTRLRLGNQSRALAAKRPPDNLVDPELLTPDEQDRMKRSFDVIAMMQKKIAFDYPGAE